MILKCHLNLDSSSYLKILGIFLKDLGLRLLHFIGMHFILFWFPKMLLAFALLFTRGMSIVYLVSLNSLHVFVIVFVLKTLNDKAIGYWWLTMCQALC